MAKARHGQAARRTSEYRTWGDMISRCYNPNHPDYKNYGGRGILVCNRWMRFENFFEDMGKRPTGLQLDRINNDGNYTPTNCRWATRSVQMNNRRPVSEWAVDPEWIKGRTEWFRGSNNPKSKLNERQVVAIRNSKEPTKTIVAKYQINQTTVRRIRTGKYWAHLLIAILFLSFIADVSAAGICLSKKQARELWPRAHLYWYSADHCWSNRRGPPRNIKVDPVLHPIRAEAKSLPAEDGCCWPPLEDLPHEALREYGLRMLAERMNGK
jgi:hypothetical protein